MAMTNLEVFSTVWLGHDINREGNTNIPERRQLRSVINHLKTFEDLEECAAYIDSVSDDKVVLIVSGTLARPILTRLHAAEQLSSVYIYCLTKDGHKNLLDEFSKIRGIYIDTGSLVESLINEHIDLQRLCSKDSPIAFFSKKMKDNIGEQRSMLTKHNGFFLWFQVVIDNVLHIEDESPREGILTLASLFRTYFNGNDMKTKTVNEFECEYEAEFAIWWYSKESFFFASLNKALRIFDIDTILAYRSFVRDIGSQLHVDFVDQQNDGRIWNNNEDLYVYRGQALLPEVLEQLCAGEDELIAFINFVSTSRSRNTAIFYMESTQALTQGLKPVLFEIRVPAKQPAKPFADVSTYSQFPDEREVLFMIGTIFRIDAITKEEQEQQFTIVRLTVVAEDDYDLCEVVNYMNKTRIRGNRLNQLADFAGLLEDMGEYVKAESYYRRLIGQLPANSPGRVLCLSGLGTIALRNGKYNEAIAYEKQAVELQESFEWLDLLPLAKGYNNLGIAYGASGEMNTARLHFQRSIELKHQLSHNSQDMEMADTFDNIGNCYEFEDDFDKAEENFHTALAIRIANNMPRRHPDFVKNYMSLGNVYGSKKMFKQALLYHHKALDLACDVLPSDHPLLGVCYNNLGEDYAYMFEYAQAKFYYDKAIAVYECTYDSDNPEIKRTKDNIAKMIEALAICRKSNSSTSTVIGILFALILPLIAYLMCR